MEQFIFKNINFWKQKDFRNSIFFGTFLFIASLIFSHYAGVYVNGSNVTYVNDIFLNNVPVVNVNFILNEGVWIYIFAIIFFSFKNPRKIPFGLKTVALFIFIRSIFISLTHLGISPDHSYLNPQDFLSSIALGNDMFFSGHTGMPFLLAFVFWEDKFARVTSIIASLIFGFSMLLGHLHYSIDVLSAFFISYTIFIIGTKIFPKDYKVGMKKITENTNNLQ